MVRRSIFRVTSRTDARNQTTSYTYDDYGRLTLKSYPGSVEQYYYDSNPFGAERSLNAVGRLAAVTFSSNTYPAGGFLYDYSYNTAGRMVRQEMLVDQHLADGASPAWQLSLGALNYGWDNEGRMSSVGTPNYSAEYGFDAMGRPATMTNGDVLASATYGSAGEMTGLTYSDYWQFGDMRRNHNSKRPRLRRLG